MIMALDSTDIATDLLTKLTVRLMQEHNLPPEVVARLMVGGAVHLLLQHHTDGATIAAQLLRQSADQWDTLRTPKPHAELH